MELIIYNRINTSGVRLGAKTLNVSHHGGIFTFSPELVKSLLITENSRIILANDKKNNKNWFISLADIKDESAFKLSVSQSSFLFRSQCLCRKILASFKEQKSIRFLISEEETVVGDKTYYQLIPIIKKNQ